MALKRPGLETPEHLLGVPGRDPRWKTFQKTEATWSWLIALRE